MDKEKYIADIQDIKQMMEDSSKFLSLSGLSGVFAGVIGVTTGTVAYFLLGTDYATIHLRYTNINVDLIILALTSLSLALSGGLYFSYRKARKTNTKLWNKKSKQLLIDLFIPLLAGGMISLKLLNAGVYGYLAPTTLVFYGLGLLNASRHTLKEIRSLAIVEIFLGLTGLFIPGFGLVLWILGFGVLHIIYGIIMYKRYEA